MASVPTQLREAAAKVHGPKSTRPVKLRTFLGWFGAKRRGAQVASDIRVALKKVKLSTEPDFMAANIEERIRLVPLASGTSSQRDAGNGAKPLSDDIQAKDSALDSTDTIEFSDPTPRLGTIFGGQKPISVTKNDTLKKALTVMANKDFSQLPVMNGTRQVDGLISWKSIGDAALLRKKKCDLVKDCMEKDVEILSYDSPLPKAIERIAEKDVVLVRDASNEIVSVVTHYDLAERYHALSEPFLLLNEIEINIRQLIQLARYPLVVIQAAKDPADASRKVNNIADLTFGEYVRLLDDSENWKSIHLNLSRGDFIAELNRIRVIRNEVMHFSPDPLDNDSLKALRGAAKMMRGFKLFDGVGRP